jgi:hypothetical protein
LAKGVRGILDWTEKEYKPDILNSRHKLYKEPGYNPLQ